MAYILVKSPLCKISDYINTEMNAVFLMVQNLHNRKPI